MNKYEIIGIVGEGAYGIVYKAKCKETGEFGKSPARPLSPASKKLQCLVLKAYALFLRKMPFVWFLKTLRQYSMGRRVSYN